MRSRRLILPFALQLLVLTELVFPSSLVSRTNYFSAKPKVEETPYKALLNHVKLKPVEFETEFRRLLKSGTFNPLRITVEEVSHTLRKNLAMDFLNEQVGQFPTEITLFEEVLIEDCITRKFKLSHPLLGEFEGRMIMPSNFKGKHPLIFGVHGHGGNTRDFTQQELSLDLSRRGFIFFSLEYRAMRRLYEAELSRELIKRGIHLAGLRLFETQLAMRFLSQLPYVDSQRIGFLAHSGGSVTANLYVRLYGGIRALVFDYTSNFIRHWGELCCESLPHLQNYHEQLQSPEQSPVPTIKTSYGYKGEEDKVIDFFQGHLGEVDAKIQVERTLVSKDLAAIASQLGTPNPAHPYPILQDANLLKLLKMAAWKKQFKLVKQVQKQFTLPQKRIQSLIDLSHLDIRNSSLLENNLKEVKNIISRFMDSDRRMKLEQETIRQLCSLQSNICEKTLEILQPKESIELTRILKNSLHSLSYHSNLEATLKFSQRWAAQEIIPELVEIYENTANPIERTQINKILAEHLSAREQSSPIDACLIHTINGKKTDSCSRLESKTNPLQSMPFFQVLKYVKLYLQNNLTFILDLLHPEKIRANILADHLLKESFERKLTSHAKKAIVDYLNRLYAKISNIDQKIDLGMEIIRGVPSGFESNEMFQAVIKTAQTITENDVTRNLILEILEEASQNLKFSQFKALVHNLDKNLITSLRERLFKSAMNNNNLASAKIIFDTLYQASDTFPPEYQEYEARLKVTNQQIQTILRDIFSQLRDSDSFKMDTAMLEEDARLLIRELKYNTNAFYQAVKHLGPSIDAFRKLVNLTEFLNINGVHVAEQTFLDTYRAVTNFPDLEEEQRFSIFGNLTQLGMVEEAASIIPLLDSITLKKSALTKIAIIDPKDRDWDQVINMILKIDKKAQPEYLNLLLSNLTRQDYLNVYTKLDSIFANLCTSKSFPANLLLNWIEIANDLNLKREGKSRLIQLQPRLTGLGPHKKFEAMKSMVSLWRDYGDLVTAGETLLALFELKLDGELQTEQIEILSDLIEENSNILPIELMHEKLKLLKLEKSKNQIYSE